MAIPLGYGYIYVGQSRSIVSFEMFPDQTPPFSDAAPTWAVSAPGNLGLSSAGPAHQVTITGLSASTANNPPVPLPPPKATDWAATPGDFTVTLTATVGGLSVFTAWAVLTGPPPSEAPHLVMGLL